MTKEIYMFGLTFRMKQHSAVSALQMMKDERRDPLKCLAHTELRLIDKWVPLDTPDAINTFVREVTGHVAAHRVLRLLVAEAEWFSIGFLREWKGVTFPDHLTTDLSERQKQRSSTPHTDPAIAMLIVNNLASKEQLENYYSLQDAMEMCDVKAAAMLREAFVSEAARKEAKSKQR
ncbi:TPA: hypothetical protein U2T46_002993 [Burkholderia cenocepacia]|nr:hypothetical protein [Burkholderia cenocepacia]